MYRYALLLIIATACGGDSLSRADYAQALAEALCGRQFECCTADEANFESEAECIEASAKIFEEDFKDYDDELAAGTMSFDGGNAASCRDYFADATCTQKFFFQDCRDAFIGTLENGAACTRFEQCKSNNCEDDVCAPIPALGEACVDRCAEDLPCVEGRCEMPAPDGAACVFGEECESGHCGDRGLCAPQMTCDGID